MTSTEVHSNMEQGSKLLRNLLDVQQLKTAFISKVFHFKCE